MGRRALPLLAGLLVAVAVFAAVSLAGGSGGGGDAPPAAGTTPARPAPQDGQHAAGRAAFAAMGCGSCHRLAAAGSAGELGPDLDDALAHHTAASLRATILDPPPSYMPQDFGRRLSDPELEALVAFLLAARAHG